MNDLQPPRRGADILAIAFAATVVMWSIVYVAALASGSTVQLAAMVCVAACLFAAGFAVARLAGRGPAAGAGQGVVLAAVSLLVLLGLLGDESADSGRSAAWWIGMFLVAAVVLGATGAAAGGRGAPRERAGNWAAVGAWVTTVTVLLMLVAGGIVTGLEAGLAVEGWLIAEGHVLVLFPISLMQRDVGTFVEHAHRLWGLLVGLTTIVLAVHLWTVDARRWVRGLSLAIVLAVVAQGILGGTRVTEASVPLAIVHGVVAQLIFAALLVTATAMSHAWTGAGPPTAAASVSTDRKLTAALVGVVLLQVTLGTLYRHMQPVPDMPRGALMGVLHGHSFVGSLLVLLLALSCGVRAWGMYTEQPAVARLGRWLVHVLVLQVLLGIVSFILVPKGAREPDDPITVTEVAFTTAHQVTGAVLLALAVALFVWERKLLEPERQ